MGKIIKFDTGKHSRKKIAKDSYTITNAEFTEAARKFEKSADSEGLEEFLTAMGKLAHEAFSGPEAKILMERAGKRYDDFLQKYKNVIANAPRFDMVEKMKYYANEMSYLVEAVFHSEDIENDALSVFGYFHEFFQCAFSEFLDQHNELEKIYQFTGKFIKDKDELERLVIECLQTIIAAPQDSEEGLNILVYEGEHLFDLYRQMIYYPL